MDEDLVDYDGNDYEEDGLPFFTAPSSQHIAHSTGQSDDTGKASLASSSQPSQPPVGFPPSVGLIPTAASLRAMNDMTTHLLEASKAYCLTHRQNLTAVASGTTSSHPESSQPVLSSQPGSSQPVLRTPDTNPWPTPVAAASAPQASSPAPLPPLTQPSAAPSRRVKRTTSASTLSSSPHLIQYMANTYLEPGPPNKETVSSWTSRVESNTVRLEQLIHHCIQELEDCINDKLLDRVEAAVLDAKTEMLRDIIRDLRHADARTRGQLASLKTEMLNILRQEIKESQEMLWSRTLDLFPTQAFQDLQNSISMLNRTALSSCLPPPPSQSPPVVSRRLPSPSSSHSLSHRRSHSHDSFTSSSSSGSHPRSDPAVPVRH
ncbi:hypothetical protein F5878DRAFT_644611 [Lentinula raphanica]|uniref:Uncharacterized protein n=1 Tax=Lentinula raphanica TaxID=153919 RepID=A0AA38U9R7_9AGAR|nr:hypothetical protein F5878DRAFT_644611 [Lentinula raphanica]